MVPHDICFTCLRRTTRGCAASRTSKADELAHPALRVLHSHGEQLQQVCGQPSAVY